MNKDVSRFATEAYNRAIRNLKIAFRICDSVCENHGEMFDAGEMINRFDVLLQYSMLEFTLQNRDLGIDEILLIKDIAKTYDFCEFLNQSHHNNTNWKKLLNADKEALCSILEDCRDDVIGMTTELVMILAFCNKATKSLAENLSSAVRNVFVGFSFANENNPMNTERVEECLVFKLLLAVNTILGDKEYTDEEVLHNLEDRLYGNSEHCESDYCMIKAIIDK